MREWLEHQAANAILEVAEASDDPRARFALLIERGSDAMECHWEGSASSAEELLEVVTNHVKEFHTLRSWPPEYWWVHIKACIYAMD